ncbi:MAG: hypothetical protein ISS72_00195 [Candidatus Brocadiae bacterium]|nr:hypothetical protein [Candidatus Brocadiia bacterium]
MPKSADNASPASRASCLATIGLALAVLCLFGLLYADVEGFGRTVAHAQAALALAASVLGLIAIVAGLLKRQPRTALVGVVTLLLCAAYVWLLPVAVPLEKIHDHPWCPLLDGRTAPQPEDG